MNNFSSSGIPYTGGFQVNYFPQQTFVFKPSFCPQSMSLVTPSQPAQGIPATPLITGQMLGTAPIINQTTNIYFIPPSADQSCVTPLYVTDHGKDFGSPGTVLKWCSMAKKSRNTAQKICELCNTTETSEWRKGPEKESAEKQEDEERPNYCNACWLRWRKAHPNVVLSRFTKRRAQQKSAQIAHNVTKPLRQREKEVSDNLPTKKRPYESVSQSESGPIHGEKVQKTDISPTIDQREAVQSTSIVANNSPVTERSQLLKMNFDQILN